MFNETIDDVFACQLHKCARYVIKELNLEPYVAANLMADIQTRASQDCMPLVMVLGSLINLKPEFELSCVELVNRIYQDDHMIQMLVQGYAMLEMN